MHLLAIITENQDEKNPVGWFEIYVKDMDRARLFYEPVFNIRLETSDSPVPGIEMLSFPMVMALNGASGALVKMADFSPAGNSILVYFSCKDCALEAARIVPAGGKIEHEKMVIGEYGFIVLAYDSEGNMFGLHSLK